MQIISNCGVHTCKSAHLLRALLKVSLQCWAVTHEPFSGALLLLYSLWRIIYVSSCLVALLKFLLSGQRCLPGYSINFCFCEVGACCWNEHVYAPLTDAAACAASFIKSCSLQLKTMNAGGVGGGGLSLFAHYILASNPDNWPLLCMLFPIVRWPPKLNRYPEKPKLQSFANVCSLSSLSPGYFHISSQTHTHLLSLLAIICSICAYSWTHLLHGSFFRLLNVVTALILSPAL